MEQTSAGSNADGILGRLSANSAMLCLAIFALMAVFVHLLPLFRFTYWMLADQLTFEVTSRDFANYWMGGRLVLSGEEQQLFTQNIYFPRMQEMFGVDYPIHNWGYPPHSLLLLWPLGYLEYRPAMVLFLSISFAIFIVATVLFRRAFASQADVRMLVLALVGYVLTMVITTQNGFLTGAALLLGFAWMKRRPMLAGLAFSFLTIKPQLGFLIPVLLIFDRNWRVIVWSAFFTVVLVGLSIAFFGLQSWQVYLSDTITYQRLVMTGGEGIFLCMMPTVFGSIRTLGFTGQVATYLQWPVSVISAALVVWLLWKEKDPLRRVFVVTCGTLLITPYALNYDMGALSVAAAVLIGSGRLNGSRPALLIVSVIAALAGAVTNLGVSNLPITPLILGAGLILMALDLRRTSTSGEGLQPAVAA